MRTCCPCVMGSRSGWTRRVFGSRIFLAFGSFVAACQRGTGTSPVDGFLGIDMGCGCFFWFFDTGVVLASASFWTTFLLRGYEAAAV